MLDGGRFKFGALKYFLCLGIDEERVKSDGRVIEYNVVTVLNGRRNQHLTNMLVVYKKSGNELIYTSNVLISDTPGAWSNDHCSMALVNAAKNR